MYPIRQRDAHALQASGGDFVYHNKSLSAHRRTSGRKNEGGAVPNPALRPSKIRQE